MSTTTETGTVQVYRVYIKATPEAIWDAITDPEWTDRYGYGGFIEYDELRPGAPYTINAGTGMQAAGVEGPVIDGEVVEADPPRKLVQTWRMLMDPGLEAEGFTRLTWEIEQMDGACQVTVTHDLEGAPNLAVLVDGKGEGDPSQTGSGGWPWVLSDLKSLLETGEAFTTAG
jgi:uncharacterized protein YndB with AHSA1/START domain